MRNMNNNNSNSFAVNNAIKTFGDLCKKFDELEFAVFECEFYLIIYNMFWSMISNRDENANIPEEFVSDGAIPDKAKNEYLKDIYALAKAQFSKFSEITRDHLNNNNAGIFPDFYSIKIDLWEEVKQLAEKALDTFPKGEIALRFCFIADIILMFNRSVTKDVLWGNKYGSWVSTEDNYEICDYSVFYRYRELCEKDHTGFFTDCFSDDHYPHYPYLKELKDLIGKDESAFNKCLFDQLFGMPAYVDVNPKAFITSVELQKAKEELEQASKDKNAVINDFTHTYGNMQATTLSDIANSLIGLDHDYFKELGRRLLVEFSIKENLTKEVDMLKLRFTDKTSELVDIIRKNSGNSCKNPVGINDIISGALSRCFFTLFYSTKKLGTTLCKIIFENDESDISDWRNSFEAEVIVGTTNSLDWNNTSGFIPLELKTSDLWDKLYVTNNEYAYLYLTEIFSELFINLMKYGSIDEDTPVELILGENGDTLTITITNKKNGNDIGYGTGKGLEIKRNLISKINNYFNIKDEPMIISETKNSFTVSISISKKLFNM